MAQENQPAITEENTPPTPVYSQPPATLAPPLTLAGVPLTHHGTSPMAQAPSSSAEDAACIAALEGGITTLRGTVNQMAADMVELMALLKGPNRAFSNSTPPPGYVTMVDPNPWAPSPAVHVPAVHPVNIPPPPVTLPAAVPPPPSDPTMLASLPMSIPVPAPIYAAPPPMVFPAPNPHASTHASEPLPFQAPPPINIPVPELGTPTQAAPAAPLTNLLPETETEQQQRLKRLEENIRALQADGSRSNANDGDWSLFPNYEEFVIHTFQDSSAGAALDWYISLKAANIPTWADLSSRFIDQYRYCAETPPTLLELSTTEMAEGQSFEAYAGKAPSPLAIFDKLHTRTTSHPGVCPASNTLSAADPVQQVYYFAPLAPFLLLVPQQYAHNDAPTPPSTQQNRPLASRTPQPFSPLPASPSYIFRQFLAGGMIKLVAPGPNFDPATQNPNLRCEYHLGAPSHTLDNC
ncbi:hypothetical protein CRG98_021641 [Punica granatum]|uniref:Retrotransposon gag domain-containing protein n=1 Tax=Punica granatum TaxID=22663 RepID=A0A2I0JR47_PUNGR|nr:hypothetical protein CRG98_021641 [Punica granatum]